MDNDPHIELQPIGEHDFKENLLGGELRPHDVQLTVKFRNGTERNTTVKWENLRDFYSNHGLSLVKETYEMMVECDS